MIIDSGIWEDSVSARVDENFTTEYIYLRESQLAFTTRRLIGVQSYEG